MKLNNVQSKNHPLLCWDIVLEGMYRKAEFKDDIKVFENYTTQNNWCDTLPPIHNALLWQNKTIVLTDEHLNIVHATENMAAMNGYQPHEVVGKHPKMFQGKDTTLAARAVIKKAVDNEQPFETVILNYKKNGHIYHCHIEGFPIFNTEGKLVNFIALEKVA